MSKERPILMNAPMVRATLAGTKTQTRRICKSQPYSNGFAWDGNDFQCHNDYLPPSAMLMDCRRGRFDYTTSDHEGWASECPYGQPGDRLWVREAWMPDPPRDGSWPHVAFDGCKPHDMELIPEQYRTPKHCLYRADGHEKLTGWTPSIHMRRWASRITLEITGVRVERLQDISEADCIAEGIEPRADGWAWYTGTDRDWTYTTQPRTSYRSLWESINGHESWYDNPWVWVVEFKRLEGGAA